MLVDYRPVDHTGVATLRVVGKGNRERYAYLPADHAALVDAWIAARGSAPGPLFQPFARNRVRILRRGLSERAIQQVCASRAREAGIEVFTPHDFRRTTATELNDAGEPLDVIRDVLGHRSIQTTIGYFRNDREAIKRRAATRIKGPRGGGNS
jgi:integrase